MPQLGEMYDALSASRRRYTLQALAATEDDLLDVSTLGKQITAIEQDIKLAQATGEPYRSVYMTLTQSHLPTLDDLEIVEYDADRKTVAPGPLFKQALFVLELMQVTYEHLE